MEPKNDFRSNVKTRAQRRQRYPCEIFLPSCLSGSERFTLPFRVKCYLSCSILVCDCSAPLFEQCDTLELSTFTVSSNPSDNRAVIS